MPDGTAFAKAIPLFAALDAAALDEIRTAAQIKRVDAGATFFSAKVILPLRSSCSIPGR